MLYSQLAPWWPLMSAPSDYAEEAAFYARTIEAAATRTVRTVLELGSGGGNNASHMKARFAMTLTDPASGMLDVSRALNPECEHIEGDMRTARLGRVFDAVFVHDAVCYMTTEADLRMAIQTAASHCAPGGVVLFAPDYTSESFRPGTDHGGENGPDGRGLRYLEWTWDPDPGDSSYLVDYVYMLRDPDGTMSVVHDRHVEGVFPRATWLRLLGEAGLTPSVVPFAHSEVDYDAVVFVGVKPNTG